MARGRRRWHLELETGTFKHKENGESDMDLDEMNQITIQTALYAATASIDEGIKISRMQYENIRNDYFKESVQALETFLFRLYECKYLFKDKVVDFDRPRYLTDDEYYHKIWWEFYGSLDENCGKDAFEQGVALVQKKDYVGAGVYFRESALSGNVEGQYNYGVTISNGEGCEADALEGAFWYWESAKRGNSKGMMNLAINYRNGEGVKSNGIQMLYWYACSAAQLDNPIAVYNLGLSLKHGEVLKGNEKIGVLLIDASDNLEREKEREFVDKMAGKVRMILEEYVYNM